MGYSDAVKDKIKIEKSGNYIKYFPRCCECGTEIKVVNYRSGFHYTCDRCKLKKELFAEITKEIVTKESKRKRFETAVKRIKDANDGDISQYKKAIELSRDAMEKKNWFDSTEEMMACIELVKNGFKVMSQVKIGTYRVDFLLPDQNMVLEIDGVQYHHENTREREAVRDSLIRAKLGNEYEVLRFSDTMINKNIKGLTRSLFKAYKRRKRLRNTYGEIWESYRDDNEYFEYEYL